MNGDDVINRAREGDPDAIARILSDKAQSYNVRTKVQRLDTCLLIMFEASDEQPQSDEQLQTELQQLVRTFFEQNPPANVDRVRIGQQFTPPRQVIWQHQFPLNPVVDPASSDECDPNAIAERLNQDTAPYNVRTRVAHSEHRLVILFESPDELPQLQLVQLVRDVLTRSQPANVDMVKIYGRQTPPKQLLWQYQFSLPYIKPPKGIIEWSERPEALVVLLFVSVVLIWQFYLSLLEDIAPEGSLSNRELSRRLSVMPSEVRLWRQRQGFENWSRSLDPKNIGWRYENGRFWPHPDDVEAYLSKHH